MVSAGLEAAELMIVILIIRSGSQPPGKCHILVIHYFIESFLSTQSGGSSPEICFSLNVFSKVLIKMVCALKGENAVYPVEIVLIMV